VKRKKTAGRKTVRPGPKARPAAKSKKKAAARPPARKTAKPVHRAAPRPAARPAPAPAREAAPSARAAASGHGTPAADLLYVDPVKLALERRRQLLLG
jgi:hypothetical protein